MKTFVLANWTTLTGTAGATPTPIIQAEDEWLDLEGYQDLVVFWDVTVPGGAMAVESSPTNDEALFAVNWLAVTNLGGLQTALSRAKGNARPLAKYVRWKFTPNASSSFNVTFRIVVAANPAPRGR